MSALLGAAPTRESGRHRGASACGHVPRHFVTSDGAALHIEPFGPEQAPVTLVLVHGWTQDLRTWDPVVPGLIEAFGNRLRILRYDHRGHGGSDPASVGTATVARAADDLAELIIACAPEGRVVLAGHSMGGMAIMTLAARHPNLVETRVAAVGFLGTSAHGLDTITLGLPGGLGTVAARVDRALSRWLARRQRPLPRHPSALRPVVRWMVFGKHARAADVRLVADGVTDRLTSLVGTSMKGEPQ